MWYCGANPVNSADPSGFFGIEDTLSLYSFIDAYPGNFITKQIAWDAWKHATVDFVLVGAVNDTSATDLEQANYVFRQIKIQLRLGRVSTIAEADSRRMIGDGLDVTLKVAPPTAEEKLITKGQNTKHITIYYVPGFSFTNPNPDRGEAVLRGLALCPKEYKSPPAPAVFLSPDRHKYTLAHEVGHVIGEESGWDHHNNFRNLMYQPPPTSFLPELDRHEALRMRDHPLVHY